LGLALRRPELQQFQRRASAGRRTTDQRHCAFNSSLTTKATDSARRNLSLLSSGWICVASQAIGT